LFLAISLEVHAADKENDPFLPCIGQMGTVNLPQSVSPNCFYGEGLHCLEQADKDLSKRDEFLEKAELYFKRSCEMREEDTPLAAYQLGVLYFEKQCMKEAIRYFAKAAQKDQVEAWNFLKILASGNDFAQYKLGRIVEKKNRFIEAGELYRAAGIQGNSKALFCLSELYKKDHISEGFLDIVSRFLKGTEEPALVYLKESAKQNHPQAKKVLGFKHAKGELDKSSTRTALQYLEEFLEDPDVKTWVQGQADKGDFFAQYTLGKMYEKGLSVEPSDAKALMLYKQSATGGVKEAQYSLGVFYEYGRGNIPHATLQERQEAYEAAAHWYILSLKQGYEEAKEALFSLQDKKAALERFNEASKKAVGFSKNILFKKLEKVTESPSNKWSPEFYNGAAHLTNILCLQYPEAVQQMGLYILKELLGFSPNSQQGFILTDSLIELIGSEKFFNQEAEDQCSHLEGIARAIHATVSPSCLYDPKGVPQGLKVSVLAVQDPRIRLFNYGL